MWMAALGELVREAERMVTLMSFLGGFEMQAGPGSGWDQQYSASHREGALCWGIFPSAGVINDLCRVSRPSSGGAVACTAMHFPMKLTTEAPGMKKGLIQRKTPFCFFSSHSYQRISCHCGFDASLSERLWPPFLSPFCASPSLFTMQHKL